MVYHRIWSKQCNSSETLHNDHEIFIGSSKHQLQSIWMLRNIILLDFQQYRTLLAKVISFLSLLKNVKIKDTSFLLPLTTSGFNPFSTIHNNYYLLCHLLLYFGSLYCKQYGPRSDCSIRSSLIRIHSVCFLDKIIWSAFEVIRGQQVVAINEHFSRQKQ